MVPPALRALILACQDHSVRVGGGAALSGVHLRHRLTRDIDLFLHDRASQRDLARHLPELAKGLGFRLETVRDSGDFVRMQVDGGFEIDVIYDAVPAIGPPDRVDGIAIESLADLRANKLACLLSRSEPRDLVDVLFLERAGHDPIADLVLARQKDAGVDPAVLGWLLADFPIAPLPMMLEDLDAETLRTYRDDLSQRLKRAATP